MKRLLRVLYVLGGLAVVAAGVALAAGLVTGLRDGWGPNRLVVPMRVERSGDAQLFYDQGRGITAEDCATTAVSASAGLKEVSFPVPRQPLRALRFDPMPGAGRFAVGAPRLETATGRLVALFPLTAVVPANQIAAFQLQGSSWTGTTTSGANDPQLTLGLGSPLRVGSPRWPWTRLWIFVSLMGATMALRRHPANRGWSATEGLRPRVAAVFQRLRRMIEQRPAAAWLAGGLIVAGFQFVQLWPLHRTLDWPMWDEANYAGRGRAWMQHGGGLGDLHSAPLYVATYGVLSKFGDLAFTIFAKQYLLKIASAVLLYAWLARRWRTILGATAVALFWTATDFQLEFPQLVYHEAWVWFLAALLVIDVWPIAGLLMIGAATCVRQEYQFAGLVMLGWLAWSLRGREWLARNGRWKTGAVVASVVLALLAGVASQVTGRGSGERAWFAFQQHYALRLSREGDTSMANPWLNYPTVMQRDFPGAHSLRDAWRVNRPAVLRHVGSNLSGAVVEVARLLKIHRALPAAWWLAGAALLALAASGMKEQGARSRTLAPSCLLALSALTVIGPGLIILAKNCYLLPLIPLTFVVLAGLIRRLLRPSPQTATWFLGLGAAAVVIVTAAILGGTPRVFVPGERGRPVAETTAFLIERWPAAGRGVLLGVGASSLAHYLGDDRCEAVEPLASASGSSGNDPTLREWVARVGPHAVLVTSDWQQNPAEVESVLPASGWTHAVVPLGDLYVRKR